MYIFELIFKLLKNKKSKAEHSKDEETYPSCDHIFVPIDSTKKVLACTKCGVIKKIKSI